MREKSQELGPEKEAMAAAFAQVMIKKMNALKKSDCAMFEKNEGNRESNGGVADLSESVVKRTQRSVRVVRRQMVDGKYRFVETQEKEVYVTAIVEEDGSERIVEEPYQVARSSFFQARESIFKGQHPNGNNTK